MSLSFLKSYRFHGINKKILGTMRFPVQLVANVRTFDGAPRISDFVIEEKMFAGKRNYPRIKGELRQLKLSHDHSLISCPPCVTDSFHFRFLEQSLTTPLSPNISASSSTEPKVRSCSILDPNFSLALPLLNFLLLEQMCTGIDYIMRKSRIG